MYLIAGGDFPDDSYYDEGSLTENGVGAINRFVRDFERGLPNAPVIPERTVRIVTGLSMEGLFRERLPGLSEATGTSVEVLGVVNGFYGESVTVAGLLGGRDIVQAVGDTREDELILLPAEAVNVDDLFIDSVPLTEVREALAPAEVVTGYDLLECLGGLGGASDE